jgi:hypothetical protein
LVYFSYKKKGGRVINNNTRKIFNLSQTLIFFSNLDNNNIKNNIKNDSYLPYYLFGLFTVVICIKYPQYTVYPIISFISSYFGGSDNSNPDSNDSAPTPSNSKGKNRVIDTADIEHFRTFPSTSSSVLSPSSSSLKSFFASFFPDIGKIISSISMFPNNMSDGSPYGNISDIGSDLDDSSSTIVPTTTVVTIAHDPLDKTPKTTVIYDVDRFPDMRDVPTSSNTTPSTSAIVSEDKYDYWKHVTARPTRPIVTFSEVPTSSIPDNLDDVTTPISTTPDPTPSKGKGLRGKFQVSSKNGIWKS